MYMLKKELKDEMFNKNMFRTRGNVKYIRNCTSILHCKPQYLTRMCNVYHKYSVRLSLTIISWWNSMPSESLLRTYVSTVATQCVRPWPVYNFYLKIMWETGYEELFPDSNFIRSIER